MYSREVLDLARQTIDFPEKIDALKTAVGNETEGHLGFSLETMRTVCELLDNPATFSNLYFHFAWREDSL